jgi:hypothetical protein
VRTKRVEKTGYIGEEGNSDERHSNGVLAGSKG